MASWLEKILRALQGPQEILSPLADKPRVPTPVSPPANQPASTGGLGGLIQKVLQLGKSAVTPKTITFPGMGWSPEQEATVAKMKEPMVSNVPAPTPTATPSSTPAPIPIRTTSSPTTQATTPEQLGKFWGGVVKRRGGFPMQEHIPALIETEKEYDLPGFAKVAALISQLESSGGHNMLQGTSNPYGLTYAKGGRRVPLSYESIPGATEALAKEFTKPGGYYKIPRGTVLDLETIKKMIAPHYNLEGGGYWPTFAEWWEALE